MKMLLCSSNSQFDTIERNTTYEIREDGKLQFDYRGQTFVTSPIAKSYRRDGFLLVLTRSGTSYVFVDSNTWSDVTVTKADFSVTKYKKVPVRFIDGRFFIYDNHSQLELGWVCGAFFDKDEITMSCENGTVSIVPGFHSMQ